MSNKRTTAICPQCKKERSAFLGNLKGSKTGLCRECYLVEIKTHKTPRVNKHSTVVCPNCKQSREVTIYNQRMSCFTGLCQKCTGTLWKKEQETKICLQCGIVFPKKSEWKKEYRATRKYCSQECYLKPKIEKAKTIKVCIRCGHNKPIKRGELRRQESYPGYKGLCVSCHAKENVQRLIPQRDIGLAIYRKAYKERPMEERKARKRKDGYLTTTLPQTHWCYPMVSKGHGGIMIHRLVMAEHLHRLLTKGEIVHHINGIRDDNRIENLMLTTPQAHELSYAKGYAKGLEAGYAKKESEIMVEVRLLRLQVKSLSEKLGVLDNKTGV
jgi:cytochrome c553